MKTVLKVGTAGALALVGIAAHASIPSPSAGSADAVLFAEVVNSAGTAAVASYAGDTGVSLATLEAGTYNNTVLGSDSKLAALLAVETANPSDTLWWGIMGSQYTGPAVPNSFATAGAIQFVTTTNGSATTKLKTITNSGLSGWAAGLTADIGTVNSNSGGASSVEGPNPATSGVWDVTNTNGAAFWYGSVSNGNTGSGSQTLYSELTGAGGNTTKGTSASVETVSLSSGGLSFTGLKTAPPVPLPAAVWLLGSGLLGLTGVARRKSKA
jgi:hypothetical protein